MLYRFLDISDSHCIGHCQIGIQEVRNQSCANIGVTWTSVWSTNRKPAPGELTNKKPEKHFDDRGWIHDRWQGHVSVRSASSFLLCSTYWSKLIECLFSATFVTSQQTKKEHIRSSSPSIEILHFGFGSWWEWTSMVKVQSQWISCCIRGIFMEHHISWKNKVTE